ncbi:hypothetical protein FH039_06600 [Thermococcus indicus]|uniref:HhH-GPD domain-containing protein n=1 Tax=Thermococcus indicus TaxID=2586643 RepID=A0A4Y5SMC7_9EURY|nr:DNA-3-methyladenine glycosylase I [Thermococcus indicus]QDA31332.1 hypothetical protein FH039_06600 [Thermococcus indicus]
MGVTAFIIVGSRPYITYGLPNPGYILLLYENNRPAWELKPLYPELGKTSITWIPTIEGMLEDALIMIGVHVVKDRKLRKLAEEVFKKPLDSDVELYRAGDQINELRRVAREVLQRYDIGLVIVPLKDSTIIHQLDVLKEYGNLWYSLNLPVQTGVDQAVSVEHDPEEHVRVFQEVLKKLKEESRDKKKFEAYLEKLNKYAGRYKELTDEEMYSILVQVIFFAGMKARIVEEKMPTILKYLSDFKKVARYGEEDIKRMLSDKNMIRNRRKIEACIHNAREFEKIIQKYGSFANYLDSFGVSFYDYEGIKKKIRPALIRRFKGIGKVTAYHYLMELGFEVMKPDTTILRLFYRLGWLESPEPTEENVDKTIKICSEIARRLDIWIRVVDMVFVAFCQEGGNNDLGIEKGICTSTPKCNNCPLKGYCQYYIMPP